MGTALMLSMTSGRAASITSKHPFVDAVYSPSPSFPMGLCSSTFPVDEIAALMVESVGMESAGMESLGMESLGMESVGIAIDDETIDEMIVKRVVYFIFVDVDWGCC